MAKRVKAQIIELIDGTDLGSVGPGANDEDQLPTLERSPEDGPGDQFTNVMMMMMNSQHSDREE